MPSSDPPGLLQDAKGGDVRAFEALLGPLIDPGFRLAYTMLQDREEAADAVQESSIRAWLKVSQFRGETVSMRPWFLAIVANQCRTVRRSRWQSVLKLPELQGSDAPGEDAIVGREDLRQAIRRLPEGQRLALFLHFYLDLPLDEVATVLGVRSGGAKSRLHRALQNLRPGLSLAEVVR